MSMKICIIIGTRPEIIKMSPIIRECERRKLNYFILHTGQHYDEIMDKIFFDELELPSPKYNLSVGYHPYRKQIGRMIKEIQQILLIEKATHIIVEGDTNSVLSGALAGNKLGLIVCHHEAGLRSHDLRMLEEINRITTDHISDLLFVPSIDALKNLHDEGLEGYKINLTGNTIVDAVYQNLDLANKKKDILKKLNLKKQKYFLVTAHRPETVDESSNLQFLFNFLSLLQMEYNMPIIFPIHHRTKMNVEKFRLDIPKNITLIQPLGFLEFLQLESNSLLNITDSGGVQEESCILKVPCLTIRNTTERPETIEIGANILGDLKNSEEMRKSINKLLNNQTNWKNPFGDGTASKKIIDILEQKIK